MEKLFQTINKDGRDYEIPSPVGYFLLRQFSFLERQFGRGAEVSGYVKDMNMEKEYALLKETYLCNNWKELDAGSCYLINKVFEGNRFKDEEKVKQSVIYRTFNYPHIYEKYFDGYEGSYEALHPELDKEDRLLNFDAYLLRTGKPSFIKKLRMFDNPEFTTDCKIIAQSVKAGNTEEAFKFMTHRRYEGNAIFGAFSAYHLICDLCYFGNSWGVRNDLDYRGPGTNKLNRYNVGLVDEQIPEFTAGVDELLNELGIQKSDIIPQCNGKFMPFDRQFAQFFTCEMRKYTNKILEGSNRKNYSKSTSRRKALLNEIKIPKMPSNYKIGGHNG